MSLSRQLVSLISLLFLLVFAGTFTVNLHNTRQYLQTQLESHAQDAATALGLSLSPHMADGDRVTMERMLDAIFDSGYYRDILLQDGAGQTIAERHRELALDEVPGWFVRGLSLDTPWREALVMDGWRQGGVLRVRSHPGYAYRELWDSARESLGWSLAAFAIALLLLHLLLRLILTPLRELEGQAQAIARRRFTVLDRLPRSRELRQVVQATNAMARRLESLFHEQTELAEHLRREAHVDGLTGLANRRRFLMQLERDLEHPEDCHCGALLLIRIANLDAINSRHGYQRGDRGLRDLAGLISGRLAAQAQSSCARIGGADFGLWLPHLARTEVLPLAETMAAALEQLGAGTDAPHCYLGIGLYTGGESVSELLSRADTALRLAASNKPGSWRLCEADDAAGGLGTQDWHALLRDLELRHNLQLAYQPVVELQQGRPLHYEALARIALESGELAPAGLFQPLAERQGLAGQLDRLVLKRALTELPRALPEDTTLTVNLSADSLRSANFSVWLGALLDQHPGAAARLILEVSEFTALQTMPALRGLIGGLAESDVRFSIDRFAASGSGFGYLQSLNVQFIKIDGSYVRGIDRDRDNQFFVSTLADIAHSRDMSVVAGWVENEAELDTVRRLGVDAAQGYFIGKPQPAAMQD